MSLKVLLRVLHRKLSPWLVLPLLLLIATGLTYRIGRSWFGMDKETGGQVMHLHSGEWLGESGSVVYLMVVGGGLLFLIISGLRMWFAGKTPAGRWHRVLAIIFALPLALSAVTGVAYQAGAKWFNFGESTQKLMMSLHQGSWLGPTYRPFYILFLALGLFFLILTGLRMIWGAKKAKAARKVGKA